MGDLVFSVPKLPSGPGVAQGGTVEQLETIEAFAALRPEWDALLERSDADGVFLTWEWLYTWWCHLGGGRQLRLMTVRDREGALIGLLPLAVSDVKLARLAPFRSLEFLGTGSVGSDYLDVIAARGAEEQVIAALARHVAGQPQALDLAQVRRLSATASALARQLRDRHGWATEERPGDVCPLIPLAGQTWRSYLGGLAGPHRQNMRRRLARLAEKFDMRVQCARTEAERREALSVLFDLHAMRWDDRGGSTAFHSPALRAFHRDWTRHALARDWLRLLVMRLDGRPVAALYCFHRRSVWSFYQTGFDPEYARHGVGQVLVGLSIEQAIAEGAQLYDLLHGDERYKLDWARHRAELGRIHVYPPSSRGRMQRRLAHVERAMKELARGVWTKAGARGLVPRRDGAGQPDERRGGIP